MNRRYSVTGLVTGMIYSGDDITDRLIGALESTGGDPIRDGDILVLAESMVATAEGRIISLDSITPSSRACELAAKYRMDPRETEIVLQESDEIIGGIPGFLLCMKGGTLLPNAGVDNSNAPQGCLVPLPADPNASAQRIRTEIGERCRADVGVIIADSRVHPMRSGCCGIAVGCAWIPAVLDAYRKLNSSDNNRFSKELAVADCIASAAELVMGESDEGIPFTLVRGLGLPVSNRSGVPQVDVNDCPYMGIVREQCENHEKVTGRR
jgi:coenzyme F420-0:L-glutamate ligase / coenzyme F420-1:gamma-L-glutamate ligase